MKDYQNRINKVLEYIDSHSDETLTTKQLCDVANFSKYHFHRLFSVFVGMPLIKYIQYVKLKRAACQLIYQKNKKIIDIAFDAGFENHESFSRAFKKTCGLSPSSFRKSPNWQDWHTSPYKKIGEKVMQVTIKEMPAVRTARVEHYGDFNLISETATKLIAWSEKKQIPIRAGECFGLIYNDPETTPKNEFRFDFCIQIHDKVKVHSENINEYILSGGRYAVLRHLGSHNDISETVKKLYRDWLPQSGEELRDTPCLFQYHNFAHEVQESALVTDVCLPLK